MYGGHLVREARKRAGLSQRELAERAGTTQSAIARLETGRSSPSFELVRKLIRCCGFQLNVSIVPYDDSDIVQARELAGMSPAERLSHLVSAVNALTQLRDDTRAR